MKAKSFFRGLKTGQKNFGESIAILINTALLTLVYIIGVGLTSVFSKLLKKDFLELERSKTRDSYWTELNLKKEEMRTYYRQF